MHWLSRPRHTAAVLDVVEMVALCTFTVEEPISFIAGIIMRISRNLFPSTNQQF